MHLLLICVFALGLAQANVEELIEVRQHEKPQNVKQVENVFEIQRSHDAELVRVIVPDDEQLAQQGGTVLLPCQYSTCPEATHPLVITWKIGDSATTATRIAECRSYDPITGTCNDFAVFDDRYTSRLSMDMPGTADLTLRSAGNSDNHNYWCIVQTLEDPEYGTDIGSVVLRVQGTLDEKPKFNHVFLAQQPLIETSSGNTVTIQCKCVGSHCNDVGWFKGPTSDLANSFETIYTKTTSYKDEPQEYVGDNWKGRISVDGYNLTIYNVQPSDAGRYFCETRASSYYGIGETGVDAKSVVMTVDEYGEYPCV